MSDALDAGRGLDSWMLAYSAGPLYAKPYRGPLGQEGEFWRR